MFNLKTLTESVQKNCHISDAQFAGHYTLCVFLLKMREYYRWEKSIPQSQSLPKEAVGLWLTQRENEWDKLESLPLSSIRIGDESFEPFESAAINQRLNPLGYVYSGGIGIFHKPYFFLGKLERKETQHGITLLVSSDEYARDMVAPPAMLQDNTVFIRKQCLRRAIWERIEEWLLKRPPDSPMARTLACYSPQHASPRFEITTAYDKDMESILDQITETELESVFLHETGEAQARQLLGPQWEVLLSELPRSKAEFIVRAVRDHLADSLTTLPRLLETENAAALHFYFANFTGMRRELFPEALLAYQAWIESGNLSSLKHVVLLGQQHWYAQAQQILALHDSATHSLADAIETLCLTRAGDQSS
jgi:hypothetical protein